MKVEKVLGNMAKTGSKVSLPKGRNRLLALRSTELRQLEWSNRPIGKINDWMTERQSWLHMTGMVLRLERRKAGMVLLSRS